MIELLDNGKVRITLATSELEVAAYVGQQRRFESMRKGYTRAPTGRSGRDKVARDWYDNVAGAMGEVAFASFIGAYWSPTIQYPGRQVADVGTCWQVRTLDRDDYDLVVKQTDEPRFRYVLLTGDGPSFLLHGWIWGAKAKQLPLRPFNGVPDVLVHRVPQAQLSMDFGSVTARLHEAKKEHA